MEPSLNIEAAPHKPQITVYYKDKMMERPFRGFRDSCMPALEGLGLHQVCPEDSSICLTRNFPTLVRKPKPSSYRNLQTVAYIFFSIIPK